jgi:hypothetical protein
MGTWDAGMTNQDGLFQVRASVFGDDRTLSSVLHFQDGALVPIDQQSGSHDLGFLKVPATGRIHLVVTPGATTGSPVAQASLLLLVIQD